MDELDDLLPTARPSAFAALQGVERAWRLGLFLATWAIGCSIDLSWVMALEDGATHMAESQTMLAEVTDDATRDAVESRRRVETDAWWRSLLEESRQTQSLGRVSIMTRLERRDA